LIVRPGYTGRDPSRAILGQVSCEDVLSGGAGVGKRRPRVGGCQQALGGRGAGSRGSRSDPRKEEKREYHGRRGVDGLTYCCIVFGVSAN